MFGKGESSERCIFVIYFNIYLEEISKRRCYLFNVSVIRNYICLFSEVKNFKISKNIKKNSTHFT